MQNQCCVVPGPGSSRDVSSYWDRVIISLESSEWSGECGVLHECSETDRADNKISRIFHCIYGELVDLHFLLTIDG